MKPLPQKQTLYKMFQADLLSDNEFDRLFNIVVAL